MLTAWLGVLLTEGVGAFGELQRTSRASKGTEVKICIKKSLIDEFGPTTWFKNLQEYINHIWRRVPCRIEVRDNAGSGAVWASEPGWLWDEATPRTVLAGLNAPERYYEALITLQEKSERELEKRRYAELREKALGKLRCFGHKNLNCPTEWATDKYGSHILNWTGELRYYLW